MQMTDLPAYGTNRHFKKASELGVWLGGSGLNWPLMDALKVPERHPGEAWVRPGQKPESILFQSLVREASEAWHAEVEFVWEFQRDVLAHSAMLVEGRATNLYAIFVGHDAVKFGVADKPEGRLGNLRVSHWKDLCLFAAIPATKALEAFVHSRLGRDSLRGEWFSVTTRTLAMAELLLSAQQMCSDLDDSGGGDPDYAICCLYGSADEVAA